VGAIRLTVAGRSDIGLVRANNEDAFSVTDLATGASIDAGEGATALDVHDKGVLLAVSDGMGGHQAGEVASALVLDSLRTAMQGGEDAPIEAHIEAAVRRANADVAHAAQVGDRGGMGATLTAVFVGGADAYVAEVGDSRAYLLRAGRLRQITRDQSLVQMMVDKGLLSKEDARVSPHKNVILQAMGLADDVRVAIARVRLRRGDRLLLCSDGLSNSVTDDELRVLLASGDPAAACDQLIDRGNEHGGEDNLTAVVALLEGDGLDPPRPAETVTATFEVIKEFAEPNDSGAPPPPIPNAPPPVREVPARELAPAPAPAPAVPAASARPRPRNARVALIAGVALALACSYLIARWLGG
jgi:PPM family protein phosphatase